jgi:hypothetical protein
MYIYSFSLGGGMKEFNTISVRIPRDIFERLKEVAEIEHRSMNQQINLYLEQGLQEARKEKVPA